MDAPSSFTTQEGGIASCLSTTMYHEYLKTISMEASCRPQDPDNRRKLLLGNMKPTVEKAVSFEGREQITVRNGHSNIRTLSLFLPRDGATDMAGHPRVNHRGVTINSVALSSPDSADNEGNILKGFLHGNLQFKDAHVCITPYCFSTESNVPYQKSTSDLVDSEVRSFLPDLMGLGFHKHLGYAEEWTLKEAVALYNLVSVDGVDDFESKYAISKWSTALEQNDDLTLLPTTRTLPTIVFLLTIEKMSVMDPAVLYTIILRSTESDENILKERMAEQLDSFGLFRATQQLIQKNVKARVGAVDGQHRLFCGYCLSLGIAPKVLNPMEFQDIHLFTDLAEKRKMENYVFRLLETFPVSCTTLLQSVGVDEEKTAPFTSTFCNWASQRSYDLQQLVMQAAPTPLSAALNRIVSTAQIFLGSGFGIDAVFKMIRDEKGTPSLKRVDTICGNWGTKRLEILHNKAECAVPLDDSPSDKRTFRSFKDCKGSTKGYDADLIRSHFPQVPENCQRVPVCVYLIERFVFDPHSCSLFFAVSNGNGRALRSGLKASSIEQNLKNLYSNPTGAQVKLPIQTGESMIFDFTGRAMSGNWKLILDYIKQAFLTPQRNLLASICNKLEIFYTSKRHKKRSANPPHHCAMMIGYHIATNMLELYQSEGLSIDPIHLQLLGLLDEQVTSNLETPSHDQTSLPKPPNMNRIWEVVGNLLDANVLTVSVHAQLSLKEIFKKGTACPINPAFYACQFQDYEPKFSFAFNCERSNLLLTTSLQNSLQNLSLDQVGRFLIYGSPTPYEDTVERDPTLIPTKEFWIVVHKFCKKETLSPDGTGTTEPVPPPTRKDARDLSKGANRKVPTPFTDEDLFPSDDESENEMEVEKDADAAKPAEYESEHPPGMLGNKRRNCFEKELIIAEAADDGLLTAIIGDSEDTLVVSSLGAANEEQQSETVLALSIAEEVIQESEDNASSEESKAILASSKAEEVILDSKDDAMCEQSETVQAASIAEEVNEESEGDASSEQDQSTGSTLPQVVTVATVVDKEVFEDSDDDGSSQRDEEEDSSDPDEDEDNKKPKARGPPIRKGVAHSPTSPQTRQKTAATGQTGHDTPPKKSLLSRSRNLPMKRNAKETLNKSPSKKRRHDSRPAASTPLQRSAISTPQKLSAVTRTSPRRSTTSRRTRPTRTAISSPEATKKHETAETDLAGSTTTLSREEEADYFYTELKGSYNFKERSVDQMTNDTTTHWEDFMAEYIKDYSGLLRKLSQEEQLQPKLPEGGKWTWMEDCDLVVEWDLTGVSSDDISDEDKIFLLQIMNSSRYAVVIKEACTGLVDESWTPEKIAKYIGPKYLLSCQQYGMNKGVPKRLGSSIAMTGNDIGKYLRCVMDKADESEKKSFKEDHFDYDNIRLYFTDVEMSKFAPNLKRDFSLLFKLKDIMPTGKYCLTRSVSHISLKSWMLLSSKSEGFFSLVFSFWVDGW